MAINNQDQIIEGWEIARGGNFLQIWEAGTYNGVMPEHLNFENGKVAEIELPNYRALEITTDEAIEMVMPIAQLIVAAPLLLRKLKEIAHYLEACLQDDECMQNQDTHVCKDAEHLDDIMDILGIAEGRK